jgi:hypothetical protein
MHRKLFLQNLKEIGCFEDDVGTDGRIILEWITEESSVMV